MSQFFTLRASEYPLQLLGHKVDTPFRCFLLAFCNLGLTQGSVFVSDQATNILEQLQLSDRILVTAITR